MEPLLKTRAAVLLALLDGPASGSEIVRRVARRAPGAARLAPGMLYPTLRALEKRRLARSWPVTPGGRRGARTRVYYELTRKGTAEAVATRATLRSLLGPTRSMPESAGRGMRRRLQACADVSRMAVQLRERVKRAKR